MKKIIVLFSFLAYLCAGDTVWAASAADADKADEGVFLSTVRRLEDWSGHSNIPFEDMVQRFTTAANDTAIKALYDAGRPGDALSSNAKTLWAAVNARHIDIELGSLALTITGQESFPKSLSVQEKWDALQEHLNTFAKRLKETGKDIEQTVRDFLRTDGQRVEKKISKFFGRRKEY